MGMVFLRGLDLRRWALLSGWGTLEFPFDNCENIQQYIYGCDDKDNAGLELLDRDNKTKYNRVTVIHFSMDIIVYGKLEEMLNALVKHLSHCC